MPLTVTTVWALLDKVFRRLCRKWRWWPFVGVRQKQTWSSVDGNEDIQFAFCRLNFGNIDVKVADRVALGERLKNLPLSA